MAKCSAAHSSGPRGSVTPSSPMLRESGAAMAAADTPGYAPSHLTLDAIRGNHHCRPLVASAARS